MPTATVENEQQDDQEQQHEEQAESSSENKEEENQERQDESDEVVITIGEQKQEEEEQQESAPQWVKDLRKNQRELLKENRELKEKLKSSAPKEEAPQLGAKPTLEGCGYDDEKFEAELTAWHDQKRQADDHAKKIEEAKLKEQEAWQSKLDGYAKAKMELKVRDFDDAEATVQEMLDQTQQGIILHGARNPALVIYAIGKNESKAKELAAIKDPVQFAIAIGELGKEINMKPKKSAPPAEGKVTGSGSLAGATDSTLEQLRAQAEKTGDYTKVIAYRNQLRNKK